MEISPSLKINDKILDVLEKSWKDIKTLVCSQAQKQISKQCTW